MSAADWKTKGNAATSAGNFDEAIDCYTKAIELEATNHVFFSNRSAAHLSKHDGESALKDAEECVRLNPTWAKGYGRKGAALHELGQFDEAVAAYEAGLGVDGNNAQLKRGLDEVNKAKNEPMGGDGGMGAMGNAFGPDMFAKLAAHPKCSQYLNDQAFVAKLKQIQANPNTLNMHLQDPRIMEVFGALIGIDLGAMGGMGGAGGPGAGGPSEEEREEAARAQRKAREAADKKREEEEAAKREVEREANMTDEEKAERANKHRAGESKARGNAHYKKKEFTEALGCYDEAIGLDPTNMAYLTNKAAVYFEQGELEQCVKQCEEAIELGRKNRAAYELVAKAYCRVGAARMKQTRLEEAIEAYKSAQVENYTRDIDRKIKDLEKKKKQADADAYINPEEAALAKERGNVLFKTGDFPGAVKEYNEAICRDPSSPVYHANLSAALTKLMDFGAAMTACERSLELDPKYVKAHARKGAIQFFMKEYHKAMDSYKKGLELDAANAECRQGLDRTVAKIQELSNSGEVDKERAAHGMADPEIQAILRDPVVQQVLNDFQTDPAGAQKHLRDPGMMAKIEKLIAAGVIATK